MIKKKKVKSVKRKIRKTKKLKSSSKSKDFLSFGDFLKIIRRRKQNVVEINSYKNSDKDGYILLQSLLNRLRRIKKK